jgi:hypothetical protein
MACALFYTRWPSANSVRNAPGLICQACARSIPFCPPPPTPGVFAQRVHEVMKIKDGLCKKCTRVRILLRTFKIVADGVKYRRFRSRCFGSALTPIPPRFCKKSLESIDNKGSAFTKAEKRACSVLKTLRSSLQQNGGKNGWR